MVLNEIGFCDSSGLRGFVDGLESFRPIYLCVYGSICDDVVRNWVNIRVLGRSRNVIVSTSLFV